jgi:YhcH/YjgK/YiaL family protein
MIIDTLKNGMKYASVHPRFTKAFDYLLKNDLATLPVGKIALDRDDIIVNVVDIVGKSAQEARMETHLNYIDIQVPVGKTETMGWKAADKLCKITEPYNESKDVAFFEDKASLFLDLQPFEFAVFFPEDGHQPGISTGTYRKIIVKIRV